MLSQSCGAMKSEIMGYDGLRFLLTTRLAFLRREAAVAVPYRIGLHLAALQHERLRLAAFACRNGLHRAAGRDGRGILLQDALLAGTANSSRCLIRSQFVRLPRSRSLAMRTRTNPPCSARP